MLTDVSVRKTAPTNKRQEIMDGQVRGLFLLVQPTGAKSFAVRYSRAGRVMKVTLGPYPALSLVEARRRALGIAASVANGGDPAEEKKAARKAAARAPEGIKTVRSIADEFLKRHTSEHNGARWAAETRRILDRNILPAIGDKPAVEVDKAAINDMLDTITARGPIAANRTLAVTKKLFRWALGRGDVDIDPCAGIAKPGAEQRRDRVLSDDELARVWRAAEGMAYPFGAAVRLLILTGARREEVGAMKWAEFDLAGRVWTLPAARAKNGIEHVIPLSDAAIDILKSLPRIGRSGFVFTTTGETAISGWSKAKTALDGAILKAVREGDPKAEPIPGWTMHDLRRTFATGLAGLGVALPVVEKILNHVSGSFGGVAGVYQRHAFADEKRDALDKWAARVAVIVGGAPMGFDLKLVNIDGPACMAEALARIEDGLKDVDDSVVHNEDEESPGLLRLLRDYLAGVEPAWETAGALEIAFELGKAAAGGKLDAEALARLGGMARGAQRKAEADRVWRDDAKQIWRDTRGSRTRGDPLRKSQNIVADIICAEVPNAPDHDRVVKTLRAWDRGAS